MELIPLAVPEIVSESAVERGGNSLRGYKGVRAESGSRQDQNLAQIGVFVPSLHNSGALSGPTFGFRLSSSLLQ